MLESTTFHIWTRRQTHTCGLLRYTIGMHKFIPIIPRPLTWQWEGVVQCKLGSKSAVRMRREWSPVNFPGQEPYRLVL